MPLTNAALYEPVRSKIAPDIQPPSAMPNSVAVMTRADARAGFRGGKYSRTMIAYDGTMPPWNRPNSAEITYSDVEPVERQEQQQRDALQRRAEQQRAQPADAVADEAERAAG